jgi:hypothetical protein
LGHSSTPNHHHPDGLQAAAASFLAVPCSGFKTPFLCLARGRLQLLLLVLLLLLLLPLACSPEHPIWSACEVCILDQRDILST